MDHRKLLCFADLGEGISLVREWCLICFQIGLSNIIYRGLIFISVGGKVADLTLCTVMNFVIGNLFPVIKVHLRLTKVKACTLVENEIDS